MTRDIVNINDYIILVEESHAQQTTIDACVFDEPLIAVAFYGEGDVDLTVKYGDTQKDYQHTKGLALSFYADDHVQFIHTISALKSLQCIVVATSISNLQALPNHEGELFTQLLHELVHPSDHFVEGPNFFMSPAMLGILDQVFNNSYEGKTKMMFFRSQMTALLAHFFGHLASTKTSTIKAQEREKLYEAKEILSNNLEAPPSLSELSKQIGLNSFKLKKNFKALFGVPVFKYLQNERLTKAHHLLSNEDLSVQEVAWDVGYDSLSSFSNAFAKKFGYRPSEIRK
ncbi:helix-turn-helix domain-containing protein [Lewinella cohaerens]|uniref:helix-turn-helix domain-containing protein n=1 Tax=Lewinella cohaerens TaxID=70995 RepID=UPI0003767CC4|nr:AraC family transcriptional regulator [Lewinella cohaerens]